MRTAQQNNGPTRPRGSGGRTAPPQSARQQPPINLPRRSRPHGRLPATAGAQVPLRPVYGLGFCRARRFTSRTPPVLTKSGPFKGLPPTGLSRQDPSPGGPPTTPCNTTSNTKQKTYAPSNATAFSRRPFSVLRPRSDHSPKRFLSPALSTTSRNPPPLAAKTCVTKALDPRTGKPVGKDPEYVAG